MFLTDADKTNERGPCPMRCGGVLYVFLPEVREARRQNGIAKRSDGAARCDQCDYIESGEQDEAEARAEAEYRDLDRGEL